MTLIEGAYSRCIYHEQSGRIVFEDIDGLKSQIESMCAIVVRALNELDIRYIRQGNEIVPNTTFSGRVEEILDTISNYFIPVN